jgi:SAM-dependent methyltransferase
MEVVDKMLETGKVSSSDVVYDLGSGDGRIVLRAAQRYGARAVGVELDHRLAVESAEKAREMKLDNRVTIVEGDLLQTDLRPATVVTIYLLPSVYGRLRPLLEKSLRSGARVVVHGFPIPGWDVASEQSFDIGFTQYTVYLYEIPRAFQRRGTE